MADALDHEIIQGARLRLDGGEPVARVGDELGDHGIIIDRDFPTLEHAGVVAHGDPVAMPFRRRAIGHEAPGGRQEVAGGIFRIDAALHRPALQMHIGLLDGERLASGHTDHLLHEVNASDEFGHGMLDLQARVHLQKEEAAVLPGDKLHRARAVVVDGFGQRHGLLAHLRAGDLVQQGRRGLLDHLLVATLDGTFALAQINHIAMLVAEHLNFDVAGIDDEFFDEDPVVAKGRARLGLGAGEAFSHLVAAPGDAHALAPAPGRGLEHDGIADLVGNCHRVRGVLDHAQIPRHGRDLGGVGEFLRLDLVAHGGDGVGIGADEDDPCLRQRPGEGLALRQEAVAGMHRLGARLLAGLNDAVDEQVGFGRGGRADMDGLVGHLHMERIAVGVRIDGDGGDSHAPGGLDDPAGDFATVGDQYFLEHADPRLKSVRRRF